MHKEEAPVRIAIVTCSDTRTLANDEAGSALEERIAKTGWECAGRVVIKDDRASISRAIADACDADGAFPQGADVVVTCGGTGLSPRDVTPEATADVCERDVPGIAQLIVSAGLAHTPYAALSRARAMQRGKSLVVNVPGSTKGALESWDALEPILPHAVKMMAGGGHA